MEDYELVFEDVVEVGSPPRRIGRSKLTGVKILEKVFDEHGRVAEELLFKDDGSLSKRIVRVHDQSRKPVLTTVFDAKGKLIYRQERGKRPEEPHG
jgi:hypothetical protein